LASLLTNFCDKPPKERAQKKTSQKTITELLPQRTRIHIHISF